MPNKPLVYVAGAYTNPDPVENTHDALVMGTKLIQDGVVTPFIPHVTLLWHVVTPQPYQFWLDYDLEVMRRCDAVLRWDDRPSTGADEEIAEANRLGIPVFYRVSDLYEWVDYAPHMEFSISD